jgi:protein-tyrosine phosphatase
MSSWLADDSILDIVVDERSLLWTARRDWHRVSTRLYRPSPGTTPLSWIAGERLAIGNLPTADTLARFGDEGITHIVNCRSIVQTLVSQDLAAERILLGRSRVVHAPLRDHGWAQPPRLWSAAALFAARTLDDDPQARVLVHCHAGRRRSVMVSYAVLRLRGHSPTEATSLIATHRREARFVPAYTDSVERWLAGGAPSVGRPR